MTESLFLYCLYEMSVWQIGFHRLSLTLSLKTTVNMSEPCMTVASNYWHFKWLLSFPRHARHNGLLSINQSDICNLQ